MRQLVIALSLVALAAAPALADTVVMKTGLKIEGKVFVETPEFVILLVYNESGRVRIPRDRIAHIEYDFATKAEQVKEDDAKGQYDLGVWAFEKGMYPEAIAQFEKVKGKPGVPGDVLKRLGQVYEKRGQLDLAHENYKNHLLSDPNDAALKQRVDELAKELGIGVAANPEAKEPVREGQEVLFRWTAQKWPNSTNDCAVSVTTDQDTGNRMLAVQIQDGKEDKIAFAGTGTALDLTETKEIIFKMFHDLPGPARVAIAFKNRSNQFMETKQVSVAPKSWENVVVKLDGKDLKSQKTNWAYNGPLEGAEHIKEIIFLIYTQRKGTMYVDYVFFR